MSIEFKEATPERFDECARVIQESFLTVVKDLHLTKENAASNPAFLETDALQKMYEKNISMFAVCENDVCIGFVALENAGYGVYYMKKLAVLPEYRHKGYGKKMMNFVSDLVKKNGGGKISIGIINENKILKNRYSDYGFKETGTKVFSICCLRYALWRRKFHENCVLQADLALTNP